MNFADYLTENSTGHRFAVTVSEPDHPTVSMRKHQVQKHINVKHESDKSKAQEMAHAFYKKKGYKVHSIEHHSVLNEMQEHNAEHHADMSKAFYHEAMKHPAGSAKHKENMAFHHYHASQAAHKEGNHTVSMHHAQQHKDLTKL